MNADVRVAGKKTLKIIGWIFGIIIAIAIFGRVSAYLEDRAFKKAQTEEYFRRQNMTPESRLAEDAAKAKAAADKVIEEKRLQAYNLGKAACLNKWRASLNDPDSAVIIEFEGQADPDGEFWGWIAGRAKNGFGAYVPTRWSCHVQKKNNQLTIELLAS